MAGMLAETPSVGRMEALGSGTLRRSVTAQAQMHQAAAADAARYELSSGTYYRRILKRTHQAARFKLVARVQRAAPRRSAAAAALALRPPDPHPEGAGRRGRHPI